jgi:hypothetical protein
MDLLSDLTQLTARANAIYIRTIEDYHRVDPGGASMSNPFPAGELAGILYAKCWIDTVQWHLEDEIRSPDIEAFRGLQLKRRIDTLNQERTDKVEMIDSILLQFFSNIEPLPAARLNSETPAWALDRLSILALKIYHMSLEARRVRDDREFTQSCSHKLAILIEQQKDLSASIDALLQEIYQGKAYMKVYKQMKMYNDPNLNPVLYGRRGLKVS